MGGSLVAGAPAESVALPLYGIVAVGYITTKLLASLVYSPPTGVATPTVSVIIPEYNESAELFERGLDSVLALEYEHIAEVVVVDDGSDRTGAWEVAQAYAAEHDVVTAVRLPENRGKRAAQVAALEHVTGDVLVTMDSDTVVDPDAVGHLVGPFEDADVMATTGYPKVINRDSNLLTKLIDMRYYVAFNVERAAQSLNGTVVCCCGVLSAYRAEFVRDVAEDYVSQEFLGSECTFGDDRRLTAHALQRGKVLYQSKAVSHTDAPETLRGYLKQQVRWMRSFWRESVLALSWSPRRSLVMTANVCIDLVLPFALVLIGFRTALQNSLVYGPLIFAGYIGIVAAIAYFRNVNYARRNPATFLLSPVFAALYVFVLLPLSFWALVTVNTSAWGTRGGDNA